MQKIVKFLDYITGKGSKIHTLIWFGIAVVLTVYVTYQTIQARTDSTLNVIIYAVTALLGYLCVVSLAFRKPLSGNLLGITANIGEMFSQFQFRNIGLAFSAAYYLIMHIIGLLTWTRKENQDEEGKIKTTKTNLGFIVFTIISGLVGCVLLFLYGKQLGLIAEVEPFRFVLNILAFMIGILSQMIMILRKPWSWYMWLISNVIWFVLNLVSGNYIFMIQSVLYEWNCILAIYVWQKEARLSELNNKSTSA